MCKMKRSQQKTLSLIELQFEEIKSLPLFYQNKLLSQYILDMYTKVNMKD